MTTDILNPLFFRSVSQRHNFSHLITDHKTILNIKMVEVKKRGKSKLSGQLPLNWRLQKKTLLKKKKTKKGAIDFPMKEKVKIYLTYLAKPGNEQYNL